VHLRFIHRRSGRLCLVIQSLWSTHPGNPQDADNEHSVDDDEGDGGHGVDGVDGGVEIHGGVDDD